ncbi:connector enhancer of kinase suppressor of ras 2-like isoform X2 [Acanthaster planci]|uniref:Connector enhancer of kinase suppressor of ras 2-like isoform X2 n=1 Tax=Acanthaster planci TaxID=133434 RepID=A0A8B7Y9G2_ACAPL|nr:connector enhancer of kinase suppressor of ras 2-like isoform X2 [Acanthaster planci]
MSSLNIISWTPEEIANWIKGLDSCLEQYIPNFLAHSVTGDRLLQMTIQELEDMNMVKMGHQELMLEAIDLLATVHYGHPTETLQSVALNLHCKASNLANLLEQRLQSGNQAKDKLYNGPSAMLLRISETISAAKTLISWLDRPPFANGPEKDFQEFSKDILQYALEMTQAVQHHSILTEALPEIKAIARELAAMADNLIKQSTDPLVIQPTTIEEVKIKKKLPEEELGLFIKTSTIDGIHYITGTKDQSAASLSRKVGQGDELLRVNEQTVVSWEHSKVVAALKRDPMGVCLTIRKRPCNLGSPGQVLRLGNSTHTLRLGGTPQLMRKDSFPSLKSPILKEEFLMPMSPSDVLMTKQRSNSDPETQVETHETHSDSESLVQEAERIKRQRRGTMGEALQRKGSKSQTPEGRPRSLPINTEELEAEVALWKASPISSRPGFSPIAGSPVSPASASTPQASPSSQGDKTPNRTPNSQEPLASPDGPAEVKKVTISTTEDSSPSKPEINPLGLPPILVKPEVEISKPADEVSFEDAISTDETKTSSEPDQKKTDETASVSPDPVSESKTTNTNNNVDTSMGADGQQGVSAGMSGVITSDLGDYVLIENNDLTSPSKSVSFFERSQSITPSLASEVSVTSSGVRLRPKKTRKMKYKVSRGVSCVDLGPGQCQGWLHKKSDTKQTFRSNWVEMWFILKDFVLYYYKNKTDAKAKGVICLPGYLISEAPESKKEHAFKATHKGTRPIYFATHRQEDKEKWMGKLGLAAIMFTDEKRMRQSVIFESEPSLDVGTMMQSVDGYHSESDDEDRSDKSGPLSPTSSDKSDENSSEAGSPQHKLKYRRAQTTPNLHSLGHESGTPPSLPKLYRKGQKEGIGSSPNSPKGSPKLMQRVMHKFRRHSRGSLDIEAGDATVLQGKYNTRRNSSPFDEAMSQALQDQLPTVSVTSPASSPDAIDGRAAENGTAYRDDALLDHYMTLVEDTGCVSGLERTIEARTSKRFKEKKGAQLTRIHTILDKNPEKNKKALHRRALQRTLKAKQEELKELESLLAEPSLSASSIQEWRTSHKDLLEHVLKGPKPCSPSDSDSDMEGDEKGRAVNGNPNRESVGAGDGDVFEEPSGNTETVIVAENQTSATTRTDCGVTAEDCAGVGNRNEDEAGNVGSSDSRESSKMASPQAMSEVSGMAGSSPVLGDNIRVRTFSGSSETSL